MRWSHKPERRYKWDQGTKITRFEEGICMGLSVALSKKLIDQFSGKTSKRITGSSVYDAMRNWLIQHGKLQISRKDQKRWGSSDVPKRTSVSMVLEPGRLYLLGLTFGLTGGYITHLSILSNMSQFFFGTVDHAALLYVAEDMIVVFEPNWGVACWNQSDVGECDIKTVENLLEGGYHVMALPYKYAVNVLEVGWVVLGKSPKTNMKQIFTTK